MTRSGPAMTLVEMVVAMAIMALLAVACMHVTTRMAQAQRAAEHHQNDTVWDAALREAVAADLLQASHVRLTPDGFEVRTLSHLDGRTMAMRHLPVTVAWEVHRTDGGTPLLVRTQRVENADDAASRMGRTDLACAAVTRVALVPADGGRRLQSTWQEMPDAVTVEVVGTESGPVSFTVRRR